MRCCLAAIGCLAALITGAPTLAGSDNRAGIQGDGLERLEARLVWSQLAPVPNAQTRSETIRPILISVRHLEPCSDSSPCYEFEIHFDGTYVFRSPIEPPRIETRDRGHSDQFARMAPIVDLYRVRTALGGASHWNCPTLAGRSSRTVVAVSYSDGSTLSFNGGLGIERCERLTRITDELKRQLSPFLDEIQMRAAD